MKKTMALLLLLAIALTLCACGNTADVAVFWYEGADAAMERVNTALTDALDALDITSENYFAAEQETQLTQIQVAVEAGYPLLAVDIAAADSPETAEQILSIAGDIPVIFFDRTIGTGGGDIEILERYPNACFIGTSAYEAGIVQGEMVGRYVLENYDNVDMNGDGVITYAMFRGDRESPEADCRTQYGVEEADVILTDARKIALSYFDPGNPDKYQTAEWSAETAEAIMLENLAAYNEVYGNMIELVICNDDNMAEGVVSALQAQGYNIPNGRSIPVFGVGSTPDAEDLIASGAMAGTVKFDTSAMAFAIAKVVDELTGNGSITSAMAALSTDTRFYLTADCLSKVYIAYSPYP